MGPKWNALWPFPHLLKTLLGGESKKKKLDILFGFSNVMKLEPIWVSKAKLFWQEIATFSQQQWTKAVKCAVLINFFWCILAFKINHNIVPRMQKKLSISFSLQCVHCLIYYQVKGYCKDSFGNLENKPHKSSLEFFIKFSLCSIQKSSIHTSKNLRFYSRVVSI